jgi:hypothetical protein
LLHEKYVTLSPRSTHKKDSSFRFRKKVKFLNMFFERREKHIILILYRLWYISNTPDQEKKLVA